MAVPFRKISKTRGRKRRTHYTRTASTITTCPTCGAKIQPHRVCPKCGSYKGKDVVKKSKEATK